MIILMRISCLKSQTSFRLYSKRFECFWSNPNSNILTHCKTQQKTIKSSKRKSIDWKFGFSLLFKCNEKHTGEKTSNSFSPATHQHYGRTVCARYIARSHRRFQFLGFSIPISLLNFDWTKLNLMIFRKKESEKS